MATRTSVLIAPTNASNAIRNWAGFVEDTFVTTGGWVRVADSGDTDPSALVTPGAANTKVGYIILRMADALQATAPVFIRIDFGSGAATGTPGMWFTIGEGSDGAGTITDIRYDGGASATPTCVCSASAAGVGDSYGSANTNRCSYSLVGTTTAFAFTIERSKDSDGDDSDEAVIFHETVNGELTKTRFIILGTATQPLVEVGLSYILSSQDPTVFAGNAGVAFPIPYKGYAQPIGTSLMICREAEFATNVSVSITVYGNSITYKVLRATTLSTRLGVNGSSTADNTRLCIRYD